MHAKAAKTAKPATAAKPGASAKPVEPALNAGEPGRKPAPHPAGPEISPAKPTLSQVASLSGVALSTVSSILSGRASCYASESTRKRVLEAVQQLGYRPNLAARALAGLSTATLGVILPGLDVEPTSRMVHTLECAARAASHMAIVAVSEDSPVFEDQLVQWLCDRSVDAVIAYTSETGNHTELRKLAERRFPVLTIDGRGRLDFATNDISVDYYQAGFLQAKHLISVGKTRIALADPRITCHVIRERFRGLDDGLTSAGLAPAVRMGLDVVGHTGSDGRTACHAQIKAFLQANPKRFDGVAAVSDFVALAGLRAATELGLSVPKDIAFIGFDGTRSSESSIIPLSTVNHPSEVMGRLIFETAMQVIANKALKNPHLKVVVPPTLSARTSTLGAL